MSQPSQPFFAIYPSSYSGPTPLVIYHIGNSETCSSIRTDTLKQSLIQDVVDAGYIVITSNAHGNNWGNDNALADYPALYNYIRQCVSVSRVVYLSQSAGGFSGLLAAAAGSISIKGWAGIYPTCNMADMFDNNAGTYASVIRTAYGIAADGSDYTTKTAGHDPVLLSGALYTGLRMRFYASPDDLVVDKVANSDAMSTLVSSYATEYTVVACSGSHGDASHFQSADLISFFDRCV